MADLLTSCRDLLLKLVNTHLTPKSHGRINHVFNHYSDPELLTKLYDPNGPFRPNLTRICKGLNQLVEDGTIWRGNNKASDRQWEINTQTQLRLRTFGQNRLPATEARDTELLQHCSQRACKIKIIWLSHSSFFLMFILYNGLLRQRSQKPDLNIYTGLYYIYDFYYCLRWGR